MPEFELSTCVKRLAEGQESTSTWNLLEALYDEYVEYRESGLSRERYREIAYYNYAFTDRYEITIRARYPGGVRIIGAVVMYLDTADPHVGEAWRVIGQYVYPEFRNTTTLRKLMTAAHSLVDPGQWFVSAKRRKPFHYEQTYRRIKHDRSSSSGCQVF